MRRLLVVLLRVALSLFATVVLVLAIEGGASVWVQWHAAGALPPVREVSHCEYDPELGWRHVANKHVPDLYGPGVGLRTNGQHLRGASDHALARADGTYRILCLGDSFTMGYGVADDETYPALLAQQHPCVDTINMGLGGYGIDQCYLWYQRDGTKFTTDVLLFTIIVGDFFRMNPDGNVATVPKPVMQLVDGEPVAINVPVTNILGPPNLPTRLIRMWRGSQVAALLPKTFAAPALPPAAVTEQPFAPVALRIFEVLRDESKKRGQLFVLALLPVQEEVAAPHHPIVDGWLAPALAQRGIPFLDLRPAFREVPGSDLPQHFTLGHYSKRGNLLAARALLDGIRALDPKCPR